MVSRRYSPLDDPTKTITSVTVGETVRVKVTDRAGGAQLRTIEDLLPAGLEAERVRADQKRTGGRTGCRSRKP